MSIPIIEEQPTGFASLAGALGQGLGSGLQSSLASFHKNKETEKTARGLQPLLEKSGIDIPVGDLQAMLAGGATPKDMLAFASLKEKQKAEQEKVQLAEAEAEKAQKGGQHIFDLSVNMLKKNAPGIGISPQTKIGLSRKGVQNRAAFNTMRSKFEATLLPMVNKGTLAKQRFDYIMSLIPKADEPQRSIAGKLYALGEELGFDTSNLFDIPWFKETIAEFSEGPRKETTSRASLEEIFK